MDDLDLDDALFLEGEIDLDLGDIFEGDNNADTNNTNNNGGGGGGLMDAFDFGDGQHQQQQQLLNNNTISPTIKKRRASRTARSNPHQTSNPTTNNNKSSSSPTNNNVSKSELNSLLSDAILPTNAKRTRRKSKKYIDSSGTTSSDGDDDSEIQQQYYYGNNTRYDGSQKQSRRKSSVSSVNNKQASGSNNNKGVVDKQNRRVSIQEMPRVIHSGQPSTSSHPTTGGGGGGGPTPQQIQQLQLLREQQLRQQQQQIAYQNQLQQQKQHKQAAINQLQTIQSSLSNYGINYSQTNFYPYLSNSNSNGLPQQVEKEKSVNKVYPMLYKLAVNSTQSYDRSDDEGRGGEDTKVNKGDEMKSPLYTLFDKHIGALPNSTNGGGPCDKLLSSLSNVTQSVSNQLSSNEGSSKLKKNTKTKDQGRNKRYERQGSKQQEVNEDKSTLINELSKLYTQHIKQSSFLRQNLINMESYILNHTTLSQHTTDIFGTTTKKKGGKGKGGKGKETTTSRKEIEEVIKLVNMNDRYTLLNERNLMIQKLHYQQSLKHHHQQQQAQQQQAQQQQQQQQQAQQQMKEYKKICNNRYALPPPSLNDSTSTAKSKEKPQVVTGNDGTTYILQSNDEEYTHGGPNLTPVTSVKVKVRVNGSIVKGSTSGGGGSNGKLVARLWCPLNWKIARKNAELVLKSKALGSTTSSASGKQNAHGGIPPPPSALSIMPSHPMVPNIPKPDLSLVDVDTMKIVANELCRFDLLLPKTATSGSGGGGDSNKRKRRKSNKDDNGGKKSTTDKAVSFASSLAEIERIVKEQRMGGSEISSSTNNTNTKEPGKKKEVKKRKRKTKDKSSTAAAASPSKKAATPSPKKIKRIKKTPIIPPTRKPPIYNESDVYSQEQRRLQHTLYEHILNPKTLPSDKRTILANEIASSLQRLEKARTTTSGKSYESSSTKMKEIDDQIKELQSIVEEDVDIVPDSCNTIGLWNYMNKTNYFDTIRNATDVQYGMEGIVEQSSEDVVDVGRNDKLFDRDCWGAMDKVSSSTTTKTEEGGEPSPLFDRLQSLLVEVDDGSGSEDDDDDIANLPSYSEERSSPNKIKSSMTSQDDDGSRVDVSALTLDQRTFIQLRAAGFHNVPIPSSTTPQSSFTSQEEGDNEPLISDVLQKMKSRLSSLHAETNAQVSSIKDKVALSTLISPPQHQNEKRDVDVDAATLIKYKQLERSQKKG